MTLDQSETVPPKAVWILPVEIAGFASGLLKGFEGLGIPASVLDLRGNAYRYALKPPSNALGRVIQGLSNFGFKHGRLARILSRILCVPLSALLAVMVFRRGVLVISLFGDSLLWGLDLYWARLRGCTVVAVMLGSDSRPDYLSGVWMNPEGHPDLRRVKKQTCRVRDRVRRTERVTSLIVCSPSTAHFLSRSFVNWFSIGFPTAVDVCEPQNRHSNSGKVLIVHAPTRPRFKGTPEIVQVVEYLKEEGYDLDLRLLQGVPNDVVTSALKDADLVVDELYSDTFMGGLGVEAAALGVPALTFGLAAAELPIWCDGLQAPLEGYGDPDSLLESIRRAVADVAYRAELAKSQHEFLRQYWSPKSVASRFCRLASGPPPPEWTWDPSHVRYVGGFGMPADVLERRLAEYVYLFGEEGLLVENKPEFLKAVRGVTSTTSSGQVDQT